MKPSEDLHELIQSLTKSEKWHFKIYAGRHSTAGQKNYVRLFDAIDKQKAYDEEAIRRRFRKETFVKQLAVTKNYLYNLILESLEVSDLENSASRKLKRQLHHIELLVRRNLRGQAYKLLNRAKKLARESEIFIPGLELHYWEERLLSHSSGAESEDHALQRLEKERDQLMVDYATADRYALLVRRLQMYINHYGMPRNKAELKAFKPIFEHPLLKDKNSPRTISAERSLYEALGFRAYLLDRDRKSAYNWMKKAAVLMEKYPHKVSDSDNQFISDYLAQAYNMLQIATHPDLKDAEFDEMLEKLKSVPGKIMKEKKLNKRLAAQLFVFYNTLKLRRHILRGRFEEGDQLARYMEEQLPAYWEEIKGRRLEPTLSCGMFYFLSGQYDDALTAFNKLLNNPATKESENVFCWMKILTVIFHFELGNERVLEHSIKSTYRYLSKLSRLYPSEKLLLQFFRKDVPRIHDERTLIRALKGLHARLKRIVKDSYERDVLNDFELFPWLESRISGRSIRSIIIERAATLSK